MNRSPLPPLAALRAFAAAARHESLSDAARDLRVTPSAVSHQIRVLEDWLGAPVFERSVRQVRLTVLGRKLAGSLVAAFEDIQDAVMDAKAAATDTRLRVSALPLFTTVWLIPRLKEFEAAHPGLTIEIETTSRVVDLERDRIDVAIRNVPKPGPDLIARKLLDLQVVPMCAPALAASVKSAADLVGATLIHLSVGHSGWTEWFSALGLAPPRARSALRFDTLPAALEAAAAGNGVMLGLAPLIWDAPAARRLLVPFKTPRLQAGTYYIVHRRRDRSRVLVRAFVDWVTIQMQRDRRRLEAQSRALSRPRTFTGA